MKPGYKQTLLSSSVYLPSHPDYNEDLIKSNRPYFRPLMYPQKNYNLNWTLNINRRLDQMQNRVMQATCLNTVWTILLSLPIEKKLCFYTYSFEIISENSKREYLFRSIFNLGRITEVLPTGGFKTAFIAISKRLISGRREILFI